MLRYNAIQRLRSIVPSPYFYEAHWSNRVEGERQERWAYEASKGGGKGSEEDSP